MHLPAEQVDAKRVRVAVAAALDRAARARALRAEVRGVGGVAIAADAVERLLAHPTTAA